MNFLPADEPREKETNPWLLALFIVGGLSALISLVNYNITNWKAAAQHMQRAFIMAADVTRLPAPIELAFMTQTLTGSGQLREPLANSLINAAAALKMERQQYHRNTGRRSRGGSWQTRNTQYRFAAPLHLGGINVSTELLENDGQEIWQAMSSAQLQTPEMRRTHPRAAYSNNQIYPNGNTLGYSGNERYIFNIIAAPQTVTVIAKATPDSTGGNIVMSASPLMPAGYPALWSGTRTPEEISGILRSRFINTMMAMLGVFVLAGALLMGLTDHLLFRNNKLGKFMLVFSALAASFAGLGIWYLYPVALIAIPGVLASFTVIYMLCRITLPQTE